MALLDFPHPNPPAITVRAGSSSKQKESTPSLLLPTPTQLLTVICLDPQSEECPFCLQLTGLRSRLESPMHLADKDADLNADTSLHGCRLEIKPGLVSEAFANLCTICLSFH